MSEPKKTEREMQWAITDHLCRICFGRLMSRKLENGRLVVKCAECAAAVEGSNLDLCCCGVALQSGANAGLRCMKNDARTPEQPQEIIVRHVPQEEGVKKGRRPVRVLGSEW